MTKLFFLQEQPPEVFRKKGFARNFPKFAGKHSCQGLFFKESDGLRPATLLKKRLLHSCFFVNFAKFLKAPFVTEHIWWLVLYLSSIFSTRSFFVWYCK